MYFLKRFERKKIMIANLASLAPSLRAKLNLGWNSVWLPVRKRLGLAQKGKWVDLMYRGKSFHYYFEDILDLVMLEEIFVTQVFGGAYDITLSMPPRVVFDLGSNNGASAIFFKLKYPDAIVHCFEPDPDLCRRTTRNMAQFKQAHVHELAVAGHNGKEQFFTRKEASLSASLLQRAGNDGAIVVECKTLESVLNELRLDRVDLLKFNIEGAEFSLFQNFRSLSRVGTCVGEYHEDLAGHPVNEFMRFFSERPIEVREHSPRRYTFKAFPVEAVCPAG
jgi:FkbM family methyltransferase